MSFSSIVDGLTRLPLRTDGTGSGGEFVLLEGMHGHGTVGCLDYLGNPVTCDGGDVGVSTFGVALASIPFNTGADLFSVSVRIDGPSLRGASCGNPITPTDPTCVDNGPALYDATVSGGDYVRAVGVEVEFPGMYPEPGYIAVAADYHADNSIAPSGTTAHTFWPDDTINLQFRRGSGTARLVNPSPVWPIPDSDGNTFGMCLFTLAQLPSAIDTVISFFDYEQETDGRMDVGVLAYTINDGSEAGPRRGCVVGSA